MTSIVEKKFKMRCICENCGIEEHDLIEGRDVETSLGKLDFIGLRCQNCLHIVVCEPVPFPSLKAVAAELVEKIQETLNANS